MSTRRTSRAQTGRNRNARAGEPGRRGAGRASGRTTRRSSSSEQPVLIGVSIAALVVVVLIFVFAAGGSDSGAEAAGNPRSSDNTRTAEPSASSSPPAAGLRGGTARGGETPERPAPAVEDSDLALAQRHYENAKAKWNEGQRARSAGDHEIYVTATKQAFEEMEKQRDALRPYTDWYEEADLGDWAMPAEYDALQRRLDTYDRLYQRIKKVKQR